MGATGTHTHTVSTADAELWSEGKVFPVGNAFRIVAPQAFQRTSFEEHSCSDSGSVMDGKSLDVEDASRDGHGTKISQMALQINVGFGKVIDGMDVVDRIAEVRTGARSGMADVLKQDIIIRTVRRVEE